METKENDVFVKKAHQIHCAELGGTYYVTSGKTPEEVNQYVKENFDNCCPGPHTILEAATLDGI